MNTQNETRENEQEFSDIKVSKKTAAILDALRKWGILFDSLAELEEFGFGLKDIPPFHP